MPDFFGEKGHERRQQPQRTFEDADECRECSGYARLVRSFAEIEAELHDFQVPIAEATPEELIYGIRRIVEAVVRERLINLFGCGVKLGNDPAGLKRRAGFGCRH